MLFVHAFHLFFKRRLFNKLIKASYLKSVNSTWEKKRPKPVFTGHVSSQWESWKSFSMPLHLPSWTRRAITLVCDSAAPMTLPTARPDTASPSSFHIGHEKCTCAPSCGTCTLFCNVNSFTIKYTSYSRYGFIFRLLWFSARPMKVDAEVSRRKVFFCNHSEALRFVHKRLFILACDAVCMVNNVCWCCLSKEFYRSTTRCS